MYMWIYIRCTYVRVRVHVHACYISHVYAYSQHAYVCTGTCTCMCTCRYQMYMCMCMHVTYHMFTLTHSMLTYMYVQVPTHAFVSINDSKAKQSLLGQCNTCVHIACTCNMYTMYLCLHSEHVLV